MRVATCAYRPGAPPESLPSALDSPRTLVLVFGPPTLADQPAPLRHLAAAFPSSTLFGCSTAGEIVDGQVFDGVMAVAACRFDHTEVELAASRIEGPSDVEPAARRVAARLVRPGLRGLLVLCDGLSVNGSHLVRGLAATVPPGVVVAGGLAGGGPRFDRTWVLQDGVQPSPSAMVAVGLYGAACRVGCGSRGGWDRFGPERLVTRSEGHVVHEIDGKPALQLYKTYLGTRADALPGAALLFPLAFRLGGPQGEWVGRSVVAVDEASQSLTFAGEVPQGAFVQLMRASSDRLVQAASQAGHSSRPAVAAEGPVLALTISGFGRRLVLGARVEEEVEATLAALPAGARQVGFYACGEIAPLGARAYDLVNQTMTLTTIAEPA